ncbi:hypothetical protein QAD02_002298 [Eretmocerus hayati]|uniref:Uncharacterized protein n=1 Tax=Eretmocerus hayati TaxID=131215 RepID=A0ACC2NIT0_9HYME|nr:hypothetical protein QAD02_002298 [Eretmocerus hayati]
MQWGKRAYRYESYVRELGEERLIKLCYLEKRSFGEKEVFNVSKTKFLGSLGLNQMEIENMEAIEKDVEWELDRRFKDIFRQGVESKVQEAKYNQRYKNIRSEQIPKYLLNCKKGIQIDIIARIRCREPGGKMQVLSGRQAEKLHIVRK